MRKFIENRIPFGQFFGTGKFLTHVLVLLLKPLFRVTVTGVVWKSNKRGKRKILILNKLSSQLYTESGLQPALLWRTKYDLPKGGWRDEDGDFFESLIRALFRELREEASLTPEDVEEVRLIGIVFGEFNKHNRHRHGWFRFGKLHVIFSVKVKNKTKWRQGIDPKIFWGRFMTFREIARSECFKGNASKHAMVHALKPER